ncbi:MAG: hypothetical protein GWN86_06240 [Desulfobacterales bacterium]|nr:hypothetical protein [Desulfobacterales bacterium]
MLLGRRAGRWREIRVSRGAPFDLYLLESRENLIAILKRAHTGELFVRLGGVLDQTIDGSFLL